MKKLLAFLLLFVLTTSVKAQQSNPSTIQGILQNSYAPFVDSLQQNDKNSNNIPTRTDLPNNGDWLIWNGERDLLWYAWNDSGVIHTNNQIWGWTIKQPTHSHTYSYFNATDSLIEWDSGSGVVTTLAGDAVGTTANDTVKRWWTLPLDQLTFTSPGAGAVTIWDTNAHPNHWIAQTISQDVNLSFNGTATVIGIQAKPVNVPLHTATVATYNNATGHIEWDSVVGGTTTVYPHAAPVQIYGGDSVAVNLIAGSGIAITSSATADTISAFLNQIKLLGDVRGAANANKAFQFHGDTNSITGNVTLNDSSATCWDRHDNTTSSDTVFLPLIGAWGKLFTFEKGDTAVSTTVIKAAATNYLGGVLNGALLLTKQFDHLTIISADPKNWVVISQVIGGNLPSSPPTGAAGGDLANTYPNPTVAKIQGTTVEPLSPSVSGQIMLFTTTGNWWYPAVITGDISLTGGGAATVRGIQGDTVYKPVNNNTIPYFDSVHSAIKWETQNKSHGEAIYGDSSDGTVLMNGTNTFAAFASLVGSTYTLTRDIYCRKLVIYSTVTLKTASFRISCSDTLIDSNAIVNVGGNAAGSVAGAGAADGSMGGGKNGGTGVTTNVNGNAGTAASPSDGASGGAGGNCTNTGGSGGTATAPAGNSFNSLHTVQFPDGYNVTATGTWQPILGGAGGGSGASAGTGTSGGGGGGGGQISIYARVMRLVGAGFINVDGGNGANGTGTNAGGGGGGGGGWIKIVSDDCTPLVNGTNILVAGGAKGNGIGTGSNGVAGSNGNFTFIQN